MYAKGNYYSLTRRAVFARLVYPVPEPGGLGVHVTLDLAGQARFGPDVGMGRAHRLRRRSAARRALLCGDPPLLARAARRRARAGYAGIRPKTAGPGEPAPDFAVQGPRAHRVPGLVNLFGIESPGLTASLALAAMVLEELG